MTPAEFAKQMRAHQAEISEVRKTAVAPALALGTSYGEIPTIGCLIHVLAPYAHMPGDIVECLIRDRGQAIGAAHEPALTGR